MKAFTTIANLGLLTVSLNALAGDIDSVTVKGNVGASRADVQAELQAAFARHEIVHGDLLVLRELLAPTVELRQVAAVPPQPDAAQATVASSQGPASKGGSAR
ncbi:MAG: hypothetical protein ACJ8GW_19345 [Massilia sp.]